MGATTDEYSGSTVESVGFEFHGGSGSVGESSPGARDGKTNAMRFRTDTGKLEVTGTIAADAGKIGGWEIEVPGEHSTHRTGCPTVTHGE